MGGGIMMLSIAAHAGSGQAATTFWWGAPGSRPADLAEWLIHQSREE
jgi:hypothetical protein